MFWYFVSGNQEDLVFLFLFLFFFCIKIVHHRWHLSSWQSCTKTCGKGSQSRSVVCQSKTNDTHYKLESDFRCNAKTKPIGFRFCNEIKCPAYRETHWSEVWNVKKGFNVCATIFLIYFTSEILVTVFLLLLLLLFLFVCLFCFVLFLFCFCFYFCFCFFVTSFPNRKFCLSLSIAFKLPASRHHYFNYRVEWGECVFTS